MQFFIRQSSLPNYPCFSLRFSSSSNFQAINMRFTFLHFFPLYSGLVLSSKHVFDVISVASPPYSGLHHTLHVIKNHNKSWQFLPQALPFLLTMLHFTEREPRPSGQHGVSGWPRTQGRTVCLQSQSFYQTSCSFSSLLSHLLFYCQVTLSHSDLSWCTVMSPGCLTHSFQTPLSKPFPVESHITNIYFLRFPKLQLLFHWV